MLNAWLLRPRRLAKRLCAALFLSQIRWRNTFDDFPVRNTMRNTIVKIKVNNQNEITLKCATTVAVPKSTSTKWLPFYMNNVKSEKKGPERTNGNKSNYYYLLYANVSAYVLVFVTWITRKKLLLLLLWI